MNIGYPSILCALECPRRDGISTVLSEYDLRFAQDEFDFVEIAREGKFDLFLAGGIQAAKRYARACSLIRLFDDRTPLVIISDEFGVTDDQAQSLNARLIVHESDLSTVESLKLNIRELVGG